jgi:hypothetical protein
MKDEFAPYLKDIMPNILSLASLKPEMGVEGMGEGDIEAVMNEIKEDGDKK